MKIITISGLDGSGKSTQIELLKQHLISQNKKVFYFHAIAFGLAKKITDFKNKYCLICRLLGKCQVKNNQEKSVTKASWLTIKLRKLFLKIDLYRFRKLLKRLEKGNYDYLISDRYFYDSVININYLEKSQEQNFLFPEIKEPDVAIYLQTDPKIIMSRERKPDQGNEYLEKKKELYDKYAPTWKMKIIDGNQNKEEIHNIIVELTSPQPSPY